MRRSQCGASRDCGCLSRFLMRAPSGTRAVCGNQKPLGRARGATERGNHRGRHYYRSDLLHQEPDRAARPGDAPGEEGEPIPLRDEAAHRGGFGDWLVVHSFATTSANVHDVTQAHRLLHGGERQVWGDAGYIGVQKREEHLELAVQWQVAMKPGQRRKLEPGDPAAIGEKVKASIRAKVEHPFLDVKRLWGYAKSLPPRKRGYVIGVWPRTRNGWPCCWACPT